MEPIEWLMRAAPGFDRLSTEERKAIADLSLLWSFFEGTILHTEGNANRIIDYVRSLSTLGTLTLKPFQDVIRYYSNRYYDGAHFTPEFYELHLRASDHRSLVEKVVQGQTTDEVEILSAVLIIILRLRNNLFHGVKWSYSIQGQLENFRNANSVLMSVIDLCRA
jgi:hypothetical protein